MKVNLKNILKMFIIAIVSIATITSIYCQAIDISLQTSTKPPGSPELNDRLSILYPLSYQVGPFQTIKICGKISNSKSSKVNANLDVYTKLEGDTNLLQSKKIEYWYTYAGMSGHGGPFTVSGNRYPASGTKVFTLTPGDYLKICWILKTGSVTKEGKIRAYFYAEEKTYGIKKEAYSQWVTIKPTPPSISGWDVNITIYAAGAALIALALLRLKGII